MNHINKIKTKKIEWINITKAEEKKLKKISKEYNIFKDDIEDVLPPIQRAKLVTRPNYLFMILLFPVYNKETEDIYVEEVDFFISKNKLITIHNNNIPVINEIFKACGEKNKGACYNDMSTLLYTIMEDLYKYCFPMLRHLNLDIEDIEKDLFKKFEKRKTVEKILLIKTNLFDFQRAIQSHEYIINKLSKHASTFFPTKMLETYYKNLTEHIREIQLSLESYKDTINALHEANSTLVDYNVNQVMKVLTIIAVITFPLSLIAAIFGIGASGTPIIHDALGFWKILGLLLSGGFVMLAIFKTRRWM